MALYVEPEGRTTWKAGNGYSVVPVKTLPPDSQTKRVSAFSLLWGGWFAFFLVLEAIALFRKEKGDTFSENWWSLFRLRSRVPVEARVALAAVQLVFGTWLVGHLAFGWWTL